MRKHKRRGLLLGLIAFCLATATGFVFSSRVDALERQIGDKQQIVVAKVFIPAQTLITADMVEVAQLPRQFAHPSYLQSTADVAGLAVAVVGIEPGVALRQSDIAPVNGLDDSYRALSIGVNPVSVQFDRVTSGSRVDVIVSHQTKRINKDGREEDAKRTLTLLQNIEVLAVDGVPQARLMPPPAAAEPAQQDGKFGSFFSKTTSATASLNNVTSPYSLRDSVVIVTFKVTPDQAEELAYMDAFASDIRLALRRNDNRVIEPVDPVEEEDFK